MAKAEQTDGREPMTWSDVDWTAAEAVVRRIQNRIFRAAKAGDGARVKNLQKLLVRSRSAKLLAIRQVTQRNAGRNTPGIDGVVCTTPEDRVTLLENGLELKGYKPKPVRRVYIPKAGKPGRFRPLGIPTVKDRVMQAVVKLALEPEWGERMRSPLRGEQLRVPARTVRDGRGRGDLHRPWSERVKPMDPRRGHLRLLRRNRPPAVAGEAADFHGDDRTLAQGRVDRHGYLERQ
jgi:N-terminal domain of reverse transcriptase